MRACLYRNTYGAQPPEVSASQKNIAKSYDAVQEAHADVQGKHKNVNDNTMGLDQIVFHHSIDTLVCALALKGK